MKGKHVAITGPTAGIGRYTCIELAQRGADLTLFCRNREKADAVQQEISDAVGSPATVIIMDMADLGSVRAAAETFLAMNKPLDVLLNNAGVVNLSRQETVDGFEETLAVNHFAPFLLTGMLLPCLLQAPSGRIVNVASDAHAFVKSMGFDDMQAREGYKTFREYGRSKLANILFTRSLATRLAEHSITVNCLHPGAVSTSLGTQNGGFLSTVLPRLLKPFFSTPEQGAATSLYLCCSEEVAQTSGAYFAKSKEIKAKACGRDDAAAQRLWDYTEETIGFKYDI
ncbi:MAG: retinol dehydrogenase-12 [Halioglobus sp.]|jgi:retinol dehydrogenase-12